MSKVPLSYQLKNLKIRERNKEWLTASGVSSATKLSYYLHIAKSLSLNRRVIKYLGKDFNYDNPATPLNLQNYPYEISERILANMDKHPRAVLDIGGNIGQFSVTINHILKNKAKIDTFEPNPYAFEYLEKNTRGEKNIRLFQYGLGEKSETITLYFEPTRSAIGSFIKDNAGNDVEERKVKITKDVKKYTKRAHYDLVKIDVEGYEKYALSALQGISFDYMFIELSGQARTKDYDHSVLITQIQDQFGKFDIVYCSGVAKDSITLDMLVRFSR